MLSPMIWIALFGPYLLFVGHAPAAERVAGVVVSLLATAYHVHVRRFEHRRFALRAPWLRLAGRILRAIAMDTPRVGGALIASAFHWTHGEGMVDQPFDPGGATQAAAGRRGLVVLASSIAPNTYVIDVRDHPLALLEHRLVPAPPKEDRQWPV